MGFDKINPCSSLKREQSCVVERMQRSRTRSVSKPGYQCIPFIYFYCVPICTHMSGYISDMICGKKIEMKRKVKYCIY